MKLFKAGWQKGKKISDRKEEERKRGRGRGRGRGKRKRKEKERKGERNLACSKTLL